jgi:hypothetical protein
MGLTVVLPPYETATVHVRLWRASKGLLGEDNYWRAYYSDKGMLEAMVVWIMVLKDREEMNGSREEMLEEERKKKEKKKKRKEKKEQKRKEKNAELRRRTKAMAIAYRQAECEY